MSGALDYIRIRGWVESPTEIFQGIAADGSSSSSSGGGGSSASTATFLSEILSPAWITWLNGTFPQYLSDLEIWATNFTAALETNLDDDNYALTLPVPIPPPTLPPVGGPLTGVITVIIFIIKWIGTHRDLLIKIIKILQILNKLREIIRSRGGNLEEVFKKAFLYDPTGGSGENSILKDSLFFADPQASNHLKSILDRGLLITITPPDGQGQPEVKGLLDIRLADLLYNDLAVDVDGVRVWAKSKVIEYP